VEAAQIQGVIHPAADVEAWSGKGRTQENFPVGSILISPALRPHVHAFYQFARNADDIADSPDLAPEEKLSRLAVMEAVLTGRQAHGSPSASGLRRSLEATGVPVQHSLDLLSAFRQDAVQSRYADWAALLDYCRHSAMPVGRHVLDLHRESRETWPASDALCASLQVLNHLQDGKRDLAALDRCYLPLDMMAQAGAGIEALRGAAETRALRQVFDALLTQCEALNEAAAQLPRLVSNRRLRIETGVIAGLATRLTARLRAGDPLAARVKLKGVDVLASILGALRFAT
jgi:farnesyl-diphosphate farnesyltransferase